MDCAALVCGHGKRAFTAAKSTLAGDSGADTLSFSAATASIALNDANFLGMDAVVSANTQLENLVLSSTAANTVTLGINAENIGIRTVFGGGVADTIDLQNFSLGSVTINGGGGDDRILGGALADSLFGATGAHSILGGAGNDTILGDTGAETISGEAGNDSILGGDDADSLVGGAGNNTLSGGAGNDTLSSSSSGDSLIGGAGNDYYLVSSTSGANLYEVVSEGTDSVATSVEDYTLGSNLDVLILNAGVIEGTGNALNNTLIPSLQDNPTANFSQ